MRKELDDVNLVGPEANDDLCDLDEAINKLMEVDAQAAELVILRYFAGLTLNQTADVLSISPRTADRVWGYARAWLLKEIRGA
jgi:DNA-directed RNA polymerase specialized sigma24 family protein